MSKRQSNIRLNWQYFWRRNRRGALLLILAAVLVIGLRPRRFGGCFSVLPATAAY